ncbi:MAG: FtsK/SpoIIIE domain-containing protein [Clostridium sp.]|nr:FtsK/SpoIIIE domain-containing protein [Clostridium sp.]
MSETLYYVQLDNDFFGPFSLETIVDMRLTPDILVLSTETNEWKEAVDYTELIDSLDLSLLETNNNTNGSQAAPTYKTPPQFSERSIFYIRRAGNPYGPYTLNALASVSVNEDTDVSVDGMVNWFNIADIPGLLDTLASIRSMDLSKHEPQNESTDKASRNFDITDILNQIKDIVPSSNQPYRKLFNTIEAERDYLIKEYNDSFDNLLTVVRRLNDCCELADLPRRAIAIITDTANSASEKLNRFYASEIDRVDSLKKCFTTSSISIGHTDFTLFQPLEKITLTRIDFLKILGDKNLAITFDSATEHKGNEFINSIIGKLYRSNPTHLIRTIVIDTDYMTGLDDTFKLLNHDLYKIVSRTEEVRETLKSLQERASFILRNLLVEKGQTLQDYNTVHENKETNILLVIKNFPHGFAADSLDNLMRLANVGPKVGIYIVIIADKAVVDNAPQKGAESFNLSKFLETTNTYHFEDREDNFFSVNAGNDFDGNKFFETLSETELKSIVKEINSKCELREDVVIPISDYIAPSAEWWNSDSAKQIEIPFGLGNDMHVKSLKITQESGQNTAVVIGIPGSGKSVFLHSLICGAAIKYSPDELRMYLIDFSGVEFNSYALGKLPHARVIAPEAEREFGLSILNELVEEGARRMTLCREHNVSNIVDLKQAAPEIKAPRILVIIDEFQKLFEIENDLISREANSKIHIIIQEFRKFGINLVLATQKLPSGSFLPRDLIANRIVFKSSPADFAALISSDRNEGMPRLRTGQCIYNSESGAAYDNEIVQGFYVSKTDIESILANLMDFEKGQSYGREPMKVFRSAEQPDFKNRRLEKSHNGIRKPGSPIPIYLGESICVSDYDVNLELRLEGANNLLVIGGETDIAESVCFHSLISASTYHSANEATFIVINCMRSDNTMTGKMLSTISSLPFGSAFPAKAPEIEETLNQLKELIDERKEMPDSNFAYVYLGIFDFQNCRAFDKDTSGKYEKPSASATLLEYILRNGSSVGVFTILQVDSLENLNRIGPVLNAFNYRVALQMPEIDSTKIIGSSAANKLFVFNRPSSKYRGYLRDNNRNILIKFKPYKFS